VELDDILSIECFLKTCAVCPLWNLCQGYEFTAFFYSIDAYYAHIVLFYHVIRGWFVEESWFIRVDLTGLRIIPAISLELARFCLAFTVIVLLAVKTKFIYTASR
jgi:hypothetical protein